jgi:hypothetical protein
MRLSGVEQPARKEARSATNAKQSLRCIDNNILASIGETLTRHKQNEVGKQAKRSIEKKLLETTNEPRQSVRESHQEGLQAGVKKREVLRLDKMGRVAILKAF